MPTLHELALVINRIANRIGLEYLIDIADDANKWVTKEGFRYASFEERGFIQDLIPSTDRRRAKMDLVTGIEIDVIAVTGRIQPHRHSRSDTVMKAFVVDNSNSESRFQGHLLYFDPGSWLSLANGQTIILPRGTPHGFRRAQGAELFLIGVNWPPIADDDTEYL